MLLKNVMTWSTKLNQDLLCFYTALMTILVLESPLVSPERKPYAQVTTC